MSHDVDRTVVISGAAGAIGAATVDAFLERGLAVIGIDRRPGRAASHDRYQHLLVDVGDEAALLEGLSLVTDLAPVAHVVGIAGGALPDEPTLRDDPGRIDMDLFRASVEANLTSQFCLVRTTLTLLAGEPDADRSISLISSFNASSAQGMPAYSAAKAGLVGMMHGLVEPLGRTGIRVNVVAPGTVRTPRTEALWADVPGHFDRLVAGTALGRLATPSDVAAAFVALALDLRHVTGQVLTVDGGQTAIHR